MTEQRKALEHTLELATAALDNILKSDGLLGCDMPALTEIISTLTQTIKTLCNLLIAITYVR